MVTDEKPQILNCNILFQINRTNHYIQIVFYHSLNVMVCTIHLKYNRMLQFNICGFSSVIITTLDKQSCFSL